MKTQHKHGLIESLDQSYIDTVLTSLPDTGSNWLLGISKENRKLLKPCISVAQLISNWCGIKFWDIVCNHGNMISDNIIDHCILECVHVNKERSKLWQDILSLGLDNYMYLNKQDLFVLINLFLGTEVAEFIQLLSQRSVNVKSICILNLHSGCHTNLIVYAHAHKHRL